MSLRELRVQAAAILAAVPKSDRGSLDGSIASYMVAGSAGVASGLFCGSEESSYASLFLCRWAASGWPTFVLTESLTASLLLTDAGAVSPELLHFPLSAFLVALPHPSPLKLRGDPVEFIWAQLIDGPTREIGPSDTCWLDAVPTRVEAHVVLSTRVGLCTRIEPWPGRWSRMSIEGDDIDDRSSDAGCVLLTNLCLFIGALGAAKTGRSVQGSAKRINEAAGTPSTWVLGREIKLDRQLRDAARAITDGSVRRPWKLAARYVVRGHWRNQACGPRHSDHRMTWIEPYWKGPVEAPGLTRRFAVGGT